MTEEEYIAAQAAAGFQVGQEVRIVTSARSHERGWPNSWMPSMDKMVGKWVTIERFNGNGIVFAGHKYCYPYFVLEGHDTPSHLRDVADIPF